MNADGAAVLERLTRELVGIALESLEALDGRVSLPQLRVLLALDQLGPVPSSRLAHELGLGASAVTRLADRLVAAGAVTRGGVAENRSVVTVELTDHGRELVATVLHRRSQLFTELLDRLAPDERDEAVRAAERLVRVGTHGFAGMGPLPL